MPKGIARQKKIMVIKKRGLDEWTDPNQENLQLLKGIALQCLSYKEIAECIGVTEQTLHNWRKKSPEFAETIEIGREEADAVILAISFDSARRNDDLAQDRWWRYRLAPKFERENKEESETDGVIAKLDEVLAGLSNKMKHD